MQVLLKNIRSWQQGRIQGGGPGGPAPIDFFNWRPRNSGPRGPEIWGRGGPEIWGLQLNPGPTKKLYLTDLKIFLFVFYQQS